MQFCTRTEKIRNKIINYKKISRITIGGNLHFLNREIDIDFLFIYF